MPSNIIEEKFWNSEELHQTLLNNSLAGVLVADIESKRFLYANPSICKMLGYKSSELLNMTVMDIHPADSIEFVISEFEAQIRGEKELAPEIPLLRKDGNIIFAAVCANKAIIDGIHCSIGVMIDISEQKKAVHELRNQEEKYRTFFENSSDAMLILKDDLFIDCNSATVAMLGYDKKEDILNTHPSELSPEFQSDGKRSFEKSIEMMEIAFSKGAYHFEWDHKKKDGTVFPVEVSLTAIPSDGGTLLHTVWRDITKRKQYENEVLKMNKLKSIGTLAGGIAHDFNNVLMGVFGNIELAKMELDENHPAFSIIQDAEKSISRATSLSNQLLTFAKGGAPHIQDIAIGELIKEVVLFTLAGSSVKPVFKEDEGLWLAKADKGQLQQVISNLILNADKAMPDGGNLFITLENAEVAEKPLPNFKNGKYIKITVRDEGTGIPPQFLNRIFDPYFSTTQTGNGLGLATVYSIINKHNGYIGVTSELGKGTTFTTYFPATNSQKSKVTPTVGKDIKLSQKRAKILVMDDEKNVRIITEKILKTRGFSIETAEDGEQAIEKYRESMNKGTPFDVVLMDLTIPGGMGGKETIKKLLEMYPEAKVIVISGYSNDPILADYRKYGFIGRLSKPFQIDELLKELSSAIKD